MHIDARYLEDNSLLEGDICIIGAGAAGISIALQWINTGYKVILLEGGGFDYDDKVQELYDGKITGQNYYPMMSSRLHYFGGSTGHWGGLCSPLDDFDFVEKDWVPGSGWPISREALDPFYKKAQPILDLGPYEYNAAYWQNLYPDSPPLPFQENAIWSKIWQHSAPTRFGEKYKEIIVNARNIHLYTYANATNIKANENISNVTEVTVKNYEKKTHKVKASYFIMACSALQNARLLLVSNKQVSAGLANDHDLVGRYFMEHPEIKSGELWLNNANPLNLYQWNHKIRAELAISAEKQKELRVLNGTVSLSPLETEKKRLPNIVTWVEKDPRTSRDSFHKYASKAIKKNIFERLFPSTDYQSFGMYSRIEQSPNPLSRITLNNEEDSLGVPKTSLNWALSPIDKKSLRELNKLVGQQVGLAGIGRVRLHDFLLDEKDETMPEYTSGGWHHMGTTRMSENPKNGVVDGNCKVHNIHNLFIAGSSCFTTSGAVTPTLSIIALSLRLSDHVKEQIKS